jgi:beta-xylosidase
MIIFWSCNSCSDQDTNKETTTPVLFGDPFIMLHDGTYYAYGTRAENGIEVYTSSDLLTWKKEKKLALQKEDTWASRWFWAPEVYPVNNKFYMYFSAEEHIGVAVSDSPLGPFVQTQKKPMIEEEKAIDNSLFIDDDGKAYLSFVRFNDGNNIWIAELEDDLVTIKKETMHSCARVSQEWETVWPRVNEGSFIVKHKNLYYLTYSANSYESPFYGVGYATATSPLGPWTKYEKNPILQNPDTLVGVGHSAMFKDKAGRLKIVFHAHYDRNNIHPRVMYIADVAFTDDETPVMEISSAMIRPQVVD